MFNSLTGRTLTAADPPHGARQRRSRRRAGSLLTSASALALGFAMTVVAQPAQALTAIDGQWTVLHGGTGKVLLKANGTYTSTCVAYPNYADAWCPAPSGTFLYSSGYVDFNRCRRQHSFVPGLRQRVQPGHHHVLLRQPHRLSPDNEEGQKVRVHRLDRERRHPHGLRR